MENAQCEASTRRARLRQRMSAQKLEHRGLAVDAAVVRDAVWPTYVGEEAFDATAPKSRLAGDGIRPVGSDEHPLWEVDRGGTRAGLLRTPGTDRHPRRARPRQCGFRRASAWRAAQWRRRHRRRRRSTNPSRRCVAHRRRPRPPGRRQGDRRFLRRGSCWASRRHGSRRRGAARARDFHRRFTVVAARRERRSSRQDRNDDSNAPAHRILVARAFSRSERGVG